jgi:hypothetical protein
VIHLKRPYCFDSCVTVVASSTGNGDIAVNGETIVRLEVRNGLAFMDPTAAASSTTGTAAIIGTTNGALYVIDQPFTVEDTLYIRASTVANVTISYIKGH